MSLQALAIHVVALHPVYHRSTVSHEFLVPSILAVKPRNRPGFVIASEKDQKLKSLHLL